MITEKVIAELKQITIPNEKEFIEAFSKALHKKLNMSEEKCNQMIKERLDFHKDVLIDGAISDINNGIMEKTKNMSKSEIETFLSGNKVIKG